MENKYLKDFATDLRDFGSPSSFGWACLALAVQAAGVKDGNKLVMEWEKRFRLQFGSIKKVASDVKST